MSCGQMMEFLLMSKKRVARLNNILRPTLIRHIKKVSLGQGAKKQPGRPTVLSDDQEDDLVCEEHGKTLVWSDDD